jgi:RNA polymerase sigma factor (sigma-70 family)
MYQDPPSVLPSIVNTMDTMTDPARSHAPFDEPSGGPDAAVTPSDTLTGTARWEHAGVLFRRWRDGDSAAMDELVRLMTPVLWHVARAYGLDRELAEDVVQTTWLTLMRQHTSIAESRAVSGWLTTCARREAWRVGKVQRRADPVEDLDLEPLLPAQMSAEDEAQLGAASRTLWDAVRQLTERCQRLLRVVAFEDRPDYARLARSLAMPVGSIGPTRQRCLAKLRALLAEQGVAPLEGRS